MNLAVLILTCIDINQSIKESITANKNVSFYIHAKFIDKIDIRYSGYIIKEYVDTEWGTVSIINATIALLRAAIKNNHDYYLLISGDTILFKNLYQNIKNISITTNGLSVFSFIALRNKNLYKTDQWWCINSSDAKVIMAKYKKNIIHYKKSIKKLGFGAPDELFFLTLLKNELGDKYIYHNAKVIYSRWISLEVKHPTTFNIITKYDAITFNNAIAGFRKCTQTVSYKKIKKRVLLVIIGTKTDQNILYSGINFNLWDLIILTPILNGIDARLQKACVSITFFYYGTKAAFLERYFNIMKDYLNQWKEVILIEESQYFSGFE